MADYYEVKGDFANALIYVNQAFELSGSAYFKKRIEELKVKKNQ
jgi:hypothetical protein